MEYPTLDLVYIWQNEGHHEAGNQPSKFLKMVSAEDALRLIAKSINSTFEKVRGKRDNHKWLVPVVIGEAYKVWLKHGNEAATVFLNANVLVPLGHHGKKRGRPSIKNSENIEVSAMLQRREQKPFSPSDITAERGELLIDHRVMAQKLGVTENELRSVIIKYRERLQNKFGSLIMEYVETSNLSDTKPVLENIYFLLNEGQATFLIASAGNTPEAIQCKEDLAEAFILARQALREKWNNHIEISKQQDTVPQLEGKEQEYPKVMSEFADMEIKLLKWANNMRAINPEMCKLLIDQLYKKFSLNVENLQNAVNCNKPMSVRQIAAHLGYTNLSDVTNRDLGSKVSEAFFAAYGTKPEQEDYNYGGTTGIQPRNIYFPNDPIVIATIHLFFRIHTF